MADKIVIENHEKAADAKGRERGEYTITVDGVAAGELTWTDVGDRRVLEHTGVRDSFEGQGLAGKVVRQALDDARSQGLRVVPLCPYVARYIDRHPDDADLVDQDLYDKLREQDRSE